MVETINGVKRTTNYTYDDDNRIQTVTNGIISRSYSHDSYGRVVRQTNNLGNKNKTVISNRLLS